MRYTIIAVSIKSACGWAAAPLAQMHHASHEHRSYERRAAIYAAYVS